jgi:hypothetical protein
MEKRGEIAHACFAENLNLVVVQVLGNPLFFWDLKSGDLVYKSSGNYYFLYFAGYKVETGEIFMCVDNLVEVMKLNMNKTVSENEINYLKFTWDSFLSLQHTDQGCCVIVFDWQARNVIGMVNLETLEVTEVASLSFSQRIKDDWSMIRKNVEMANRTTHHSYLQDLRKHNFTYNHNETSLIISKSLAEHSYVTMKKPFRYGNTDGSHLLKIKFS